MMNRIVCAGVFAALIAGAGGAGWTQGMGPAAGQGSGLTGEKRPMTFADLQRMKRVGDPQISPSGKWVMFSVVDVDLEKNSKVTHLWVVPMAASGMTPAKERQVTFWKGGESGGGFSPGGRGVFFFAGEM